MARLYPWMEFGAIEVANVIRTLSYVRRGLAGPQANAGTLCGDDDCETVDEGPYISPEADFAPWFDSDYSQSGEFLGLLAEIRLQPVMSRSVTARSNGGGDIGPACARPRVVEVTGQMFAGSAAGMSYGERWLENTLTGSMSGCSNDDLTILPACGAAGDADGFVTVGGVSGSYAGTADTAALDIVGDIDVAVEYEGDWTSAHQALMSKWLTTGNQRSWFLSVGASGSVNLFWSTNGAGGGPAAISTAVVPFADGARGWVRATLDVNNGGGGYTANFYTSTDGVSWSALGSPVTDTPATSIFSGTASLLVGNLLPTGNAASGNIYHARLRNGIAGTIVAEPDFSIATALPLVEHSNSWNIAGSATFTPAQTQGALRTLKNVGLTDGPVYSSPVSNETQVQDFAFTLTAGSPWLHAPEVAVATGVNIASVTSTCFDLNAQDVLTARHACRITIGGGSGTLDNVQITAQLAPCAFPTADDYTYEIVNLPVGYQLILDSATEEVYALDTDLNRVSGLAYLDFDGQFRHLFANKGETMCVCVDSSAGTGMTGATLSVQTIRQEV